MMDDRALYQSLYDRDDYCPTGTGVAHAAWHYPLLRGLKRGEVIEFGCGRGEVLDWAWTEGFTTFGSDLVKPPNFDYSRHGWINPERLDTYPNHLVDWVWSFDVLEHLAPDEIPGKLALFARLARRGQIHCVWTCSDVRWSSALNATVECHRCREPEPWWLDHLTAAYRKTTGASIFVLPTDRVGRFWLCAFNS